MTADLYQRPSRDQIAARVNGTTPAPKPAPAEQDPAALFAVHARAALRARGLNSADLQTRTGCTAIIVSKAVNGTGATLEVAGKIAAVLGRDLAGMLVPYTCATCTGTPPAGFRCLECGTEAVSGGTP